MYVPKQYAMADPELIWKFIESHNFGTLVTVANGMPSASHLPFLAVPGRDDGIDLVGHMAKANPQWIDADGKAGLAIFQGPHAYISPAWYQEPNTVPTWNYLAVHVRGILELIFDHNELLDLVEQQVNFQERTQPNPWRFEKDTAFAKTIVGQIVGFRIKVETIEGQWKLNQHHSVARRERVIHALEQRSDDNSQGIAQAMRNTQANPTHP